MEKIFIWASEYDVMISLAETEEEAKKLIFNTKIMTISNNTYAHRNGCKTTLAKEISLTDVDNDFMISEIENEREYNDFIDALSKEPIIMSSSSLILHHYNE